MSTNTGDGSYRINITNGLLLYYHHYSYYSQKVNDSINLKFFIFIRFSIEDDCKEIVEVNSIFPVATIVNLNNYHSLNTYKHVMLLISNVL